MLVAVPTGYRYDAAADTRSPQPGLIQSLCAGLAHRWKPWDIFVILTSFFDESGTHGDAPVTVMAGVMATANQWRRFEGETAKLKRNYGFNVFHTKEFKDRKGEFSGWPNHKRISLLSELAEVANEKRIMESVMFSLSNQEY